MLGNDIPALLQHVRRLAATTSSDEQLLADFLARRSEEAFAALVGRHGSMVFNVCRRILHDTQAAEDVFQATFLVLADRAGAIHRPQALAGFLHGVAYRLAVRVRRRKMQSLPAISDKAAGPVEELAWKEMLRILDDELSRLSEPYRAPLVLCYLEGRTQHEAARQLGWSLNTLRRRLAQGRRLLEARLRGRGVTLPAARTGVLAASAVSVPAPLRAATLAAVAARAVGGGSAGAAVLAAARRALAVVLPTSTRKFVALVTIVALGAVCFGYGLPPHAQHTSAAQGTKADRSPPALIPHPSSLTPSSSTTPARFGTARYRYGTLISSLAVSADGRLAAVAGGWGSFSPARVFDLTDGRCLYSIGANSPGSAVEAVGLSPDGKVLAVKDNTFIDFREARTGKELRKIKYLPSTGGSRSITDWLTFTPDGKQMAAVLIGHAVQLMDVATGNVIRTFDPGSAASACVFSPDGKWLATAGYEKENGAYLARRWEVRTGRQLRRFPVGNFPAGNGGKRALAFSPDGTLLVGGGFGDARLHLWATATGKELKVFPPINADIASIAFAADGHTVAAAGDRIYLYDIDTGQERLHINRRARELAFNRDGTVLTGAVSGAIYRWDATTGRQMTPAAAQDSGVQQIVTCPNGRQLFTTDQEGNLYAWDTTGGQPPRRIAGGVERGVVASPDGKFLAWAVAIDARHPDPTGRKWYQIASRVRLYDIVGQRIIDRLPGLPGQASMVAFMPDGRTLLTLGGGFGDGTVQLRNVETGRELRSFTITRPPLAKVPPARRSNAGIPFYTTRRAALSPDGQMLAIGPDWEDDLQLRQHEPVRLWNVATGKPGLELKIPASAFRVPNEAGTGRLLDLSLIRVNRKMTSAAGRAFSPDGRLLADWALNPFGRSRMDHVCVWDLATGRAVALLSAGSRPGAANAAFAPDGRTLATADADGTVRLWEVATWKVRAEFRGHRDKVTALAFGPDGRLFTGGQDTVVLGWDTRPPQQPFKGSLAEAWKALAALDARAAFRAEGRFLAEPDKAIDWLAGPLTPASQLPPARIKALIADLNANRFATRELATAELKEHWPATAAAVREAVTKATSLEARRRAEAIIRQMETGVPPAQMLRTLRSVEILEWIGTKKARGLLLKLAQGTPDARLTREAKAACKRLE